jgi:ribosomal protein L7/L12
MSRCPFCDCQNPPGAKACRNCRAELPDANETALPTDDEKLADLIKRGEKIGAVKFYRERTGVGLKEAVDAIEAMQRGGRPPGRSGSATDPSDVAEIVALLEQGKKIAAIKLYRDKTGAGLANAKAAVEALASERGITFPRSGCAGVVLTCVVIGLVAARILC